MKSLRIIWDVVSMELRRAFSYRSDFWISFIVGTIARVGMAYFLWRSIFAFSHSQQIAGLSFQQMMLYSVLAYLVDQIVRSSTLKIGIISREIYDGSLTRYLIYPLSVFKFKFSIVFSQTLVGLLQFVIGITFYTLIFGWPESPALSVSSILLGLACLLPAMFLFFLVAFVIELTAFWADNVWSLLVMLRFVSAFLGGAFLPLDLFPPQIKQILMLLPFYHMIGVPVGALMGRYSFATVMTSILISFVWSSVFYGLWLVVWRRGIRKFSGVGI